MKGARGVGCLLIDQLEKRQMKGAKGREDEN
jgi:hypothetical protein